MTQNSQIMNNMNNNMNYMMGMNNNYMNQMYNNMNMNDVMQKNNNIMGNNIRMSNNGMFGMYNNIMQINNNMMGNSNRMNNGGMMGMNPSIMTQNKQNALTRIKKEYNDINQNPISNIGVSVGLVNANDLFLWRCTMTGPADTSFKKGLFYLRVKFPEDYPKSKPEVYFTTPIYHVNVKHTISKSPGDERLGHVCISSLNWWKPENNMRDVLTHIFALFYKGNPKSPYGLDRQKEMLENRDLYEKKCMYFTQKYASPLCKDVEFTSDWDFTYQ